MLKFLFFFVVTAINFQIINSSYTPLSTNGFACSNNLYYNAQTQRCEYNLNGINYYDLSYQCDYLNGYAEYTDQNSVTRCRKITSYKLGQSCKYYSADITNQSLICQECSPGYALLNGFCLSLPNNTGCKVLLTSASNPSQIQCQACLNNYTLQGGGCQICIKNGANYCTQTSPSNPCQCTACSDNFVLDPNGSGCIKCPYNGCVCSTSQSGQNISYTCNSCLKGYYMDVNLEGVNQCFSCETKFGSQCNTCTKQQCTECKDLYYLNSSSQCTSCPIGTNCSSYTSIIGCVNQNDSLFTVTGSSFKYCSQTDPYAITNPLNPVTMQCRNGYTNLNGRCISTLINSNQPTCGDYCINCLQNAANNQYYCTLCQVNYALLNSSQTCITCQGLTYQQQQDNDIFFFSPQSCYTSMSNPQKDPNCLHEFGFTTQGVCLICAPGYKLISSVCTQCITSSLNGSVLTITYACKTQPATITLNITPYSVNPSQDPQTQPQFYSAMLGIPQTLLKNFQIQVINPKPTDDNQTNNNKPQNDTENTNNQSSQNTSNIQNIQNKSFKDILFQKILFLAIFIAIL
ncbi:hypothetical protein TTHERM_00487010 (macronuclear) [Tetrahymena thermophila SB210]|uniref:Zinc finger lsd1 subclass family protein n=1 Tax=Tetrahymena thermophila (strain SB210) TaxID=312017 RepID=I7MGK3_TETTS|nr:hypothetical protein TTHERM_00487010 [Tetrahymena thermophila SB210]EAR85250.2 hypothetical protein TTHERM_00487010 [Tetrahymena thermophila SB210]|eukprot:XP_001032913.2 hypothetical protein TTHERM_00487010 [Tetrahymena thermophila SB210]